MPHFSSQDPASFGWRSGLLADIVPFSYRGHEFPGGIARGTDSLFRGALDAICAEEGFRLADSTGLDAGMWGYQNRTKSSGNGLSFHAYGLALDINAPWNPYGSSEPRPSSLRLPSNTQQLVRPYGLLWGGGPSGFGDWMHLELHLTPDEAAQISDTPVGDVAENAWPLPPGYYFGPRNGPTQSVSNQVNPKTAWLSALRWAQTRLGVTADGLYGPNTAAATRAYQARVGLSPDGLIGPKTWAALKG